MDEPRALRVGFIGAGFSARLYAEAYHQVRGIGVTLTRVVASRPERARQVAEEFGIGAVAASAEAVFGAAEFPFDEPLRGINGGSDEV